MYFKNYIYTIYILKVYNGCKIMDNDIKKISSYIIINGQTTLLTNSKIN